MGALDRLQRKGVTAEQKAQYEETTKSLAKLDRIADAFVKEGMAVPELERIRRALKTAHAALGELFTEAEGKK